MGLGDSRFSLTAVGDLMLDRELRVPRIFHFQPEGVECAPGFVGRFRIPFVNSRDSRDWLHARHSSTAGADATAHMSQCVALKLPPEADSLEFPFSGISAELRRSDIVFGNLECALTRRHQRTRNDSCFRCSPTYARALAAAPFHVMALANNHAMDYGEGGLADTICALKENGILTAGAGADQAAARKPAITRAGGSVIACLAYSMIGTHADYALDDECGIAPLNPLVIEKDVRDARKEADCVLVSVHWGEEMRAVPDERLVAVAHLIVENGADAVIGHHPHVPGGIELFRGKPIFYSLGNFVFGHHHTYWADNMLARLVWSKGRWQTLEVMAVSAGYRPVLLEGARAGALYRHVQRASEVFGTKMTVDERRAVVHFGAGG